MISLNHQYHYFCKDGMKIENDTDTKDQAADRSYVKCGQDGEYRMTQNFGNNEYTVCSKRIGTLQL